MIPFSARNFVNSRPISAFFQAAPCALVDRAAGELVRNFQRLSRLPARGSEQCRGGDGARQKVTSR